MACLPRPAVQRLLGVFIICIGLLVNLDALNAAALQIAETDAALTVSSDDQIVLVYNKQSPPLPKGMNPDYRRSAFLHPVNTPLGKTVTDTFPKDHPHQHGIFSAWVKTTYGDKEIDFWNLAGKAGTVVHERVVSTFSEDGNVGFEVDMLHRALEPRSVDILRERWRVTVYEPKENSFCFDIESTQEALTDTPLVIQKYHYGGMALRGVSRWLSKKDKDQESDRELILEPSSFINNLGQDRIEGNHAPSTWVALSGTIDQKDVSIAVLGHPQNFRAPQLARLHGTKPYFCFTPCVNESFEISKTKPLHERYRYLLTDAPPDADWIEENWQLYAKQIVSRRR
ncbi:MAG: PmoA family protein [Pirellulaceae bacterium]|nr:PmoA family protein [Pirellulaceae bacterium]